MTISEDMTIWYPGVYHGRVFDEQYQQKVADISLVDLVELVQKRAKEDGEWAIENDHVGDNEDKMRKMMAWVSDPVNIEQCADYILRGGMTESVDWLCRDLANASRWVGSSSD